MPQMTLGEAWMVFGKDARDVLRDLSSKPRKERVALARTMLDEAKKMAKKLMAKHHPDRGGDSKMFVRVQNAIASLEEHTNEFELRMQEAILRAEEKALKSNRVLIKIE